MSSAIVDRYDRVADGYRHWAVVLRPGGERLLDRVDSAQPELARGRSLRVLDVGCGTGNQLIAAVRRWPGARITGLDASAGMLRHARAGLDRLPADRERVELVQGDAAALPFADAEFDAIVSGFVVQLVPERPPVLRELLRVLRPSGVIGAVCWVAERDEMAFEPENVFEACLDDLGISRTPRDEKRAGDFGSVRGAAAEFRRAGFVRVAARADMLDHDWTPESYAAYKRESRELDLYESLEPELAERLARRFRARLDAIYAASPDTFRFRPPIVSIVARRP